MKKFFLGAGAGILAFWLFLWYLVPTMPLLTLITFYCVFKPGCMG